jgi:hypothetical protein
MDILQLLLARADRFLVSYNMMDAVDMHVKQR